MREPLGGIRALLQEDDLGLLQVCVCEAIGVGVFVREYKYSELVTGDPGRLVIPSRLVPAAWLAPWVHRLCTQRRPDAAALRGETALDSAKRRSFKS